ncbi:MAG: hypothetical protein IJ410_05270 [Oscillospiraceae bacterium]|nr:hypothetical protein [Oscillospiraceae bacterium]
MRIAVTYNNGMVYPHYSRTPQLKIYDVHGGRIVATEIVMAYGSMRRSSVTDLLRDYKVDVVICGRMGLATRLVVSALGIEIVDRASGSADHAVSVYTGIPSGYHAPVRPPVTHSASLPRYRLTAKDKPPVQPPQPQTPLRTPQPKPPVKQPSRQKPRSSRVAPSPFDRSAQGAKPPMTGRQPQQPSRPQQPVQPGTQSSSRGGGFRKPARNGRFK